MHAWPIGLGPVGPLAVLLPIILWLTCKDRSPYVDDHGREVINFGLSFVLLNVVLAVTVVGLLLIPVLWVVALISVIRGAIAAGHGEYFRYPLTFRFFS